MKKLKDFFKNLPVKTWLKDLWDTICAHPGFWFSILLITLISSLSTDGATWLFSLVCFIAGWFRIFEGLDDYKKFN